MVDGLDSGKPATKHKTEAAEAPGASDREVGGIARTALSLEAFASPKVFTPAKATEPAVTATDTSSHDINGLTIRRKLSVEEITEAIASKRASTAAGQMEQYPLIPQITRAADSGLTTDVTRYRDENGNRYDDAHYPDGKLMSRSILSADGKTKENQEYHEYKDERTGQNVHYLARTDQYFTDSEGQVTHLLKNIDPGGR
jgi:hypothetical protein